MRGLFLFCCVYIVRTIKTNENNLGKSLRRRKDIEMKKLVLAAMMMGIIAF